MAYSGGGCWFLSPDLCNSFELCLFNIVSHHYSSSYI